VAVALDDVNCASPSAELFSHTAAVASQNSTSPDVTGFPPDVTVAVNTIGVLYGTVVADIANVVAVAAGVAHACGAAIATHNTTTNCNTVRTPRVQLKFAEFITTLFTSAREDKILNIGGGSSISADCVPTKPPQKYRAGFCAGITRKLQPQYLRAFAALPDYSVIPTCAYGEIVATSSKFA
jgi:hypothetical protein